MEPEQTDAWRLQRREAQRAQAARTRRRRGGAVAAVLLMLGAASAAVLAGEGGPASPGPREAPRVAHLTPKTVPGAPGTRGRRIPRRAPTSDAGARVVRRALAAGISYISVGSARRRDVALTFDDGPGPSTAAIVHELRSLKVPATFFIVGRAAAAMPQLLREEHRLGFVLGNHTQDHAFLSHDSGLTQATQITRADIAIRRAGVTPLALFRPPYGSFTVQTLGLLKRLRKLMVLWTVDTKDFARPGKSKIIYTALSGAKPGAIVLMHDGGGNRDQTAQALPKIVQGLRRRGFHLVTMPRLLRDDPPPRHQPPPHSLSGP